MVTFRETEQWYFKSGVDLIGPHPSRDSALKKAYQTIYAKKGSSQVYAPITLVTFIESTISLEGVELLKSLKEEAEGQGISNPALDALISAPESKWMQQWDKDISEALDKLFASQQVSPKHKIEEMYVVYPREYLAKAKTW